MKVIIPTWYTCTVLIPWTTMPPNITTVWIALFHPNGPYAVEGSGKRDIVRTHKTYRPSGTGGIVCTTRGRRQRTDGRQWHEKNETRATSGIRGYNWEAVVAVGRYLKNSKLSHACISFIHTSDWTAVLCRCVSSTGRGADGWPPPPLAFLCLMLALP